MPVTTSGGGGVAAGTVAHFAAATAPQGWLKANGAAISRSLYSVLFTAIGTAHGAGNGSTTFNIPDMRGEFLRGLDDGRGVDSGRVIGTYQTQAIQAHNHSGVVGGNAVGMGYGGQAAPIGNNSIGSTGGSETRPRNKALLACIKF